MTLSLEDIFFEKMQGGQIDHPPSRFRVNFIKFIVLLFTFLVILFAQYKVCMIRGISFSKFSGVLPTFTGRNAIGNC